MARLYVKAFSCIDEADFSLSKIAILIGPQASGKSIISKLVYFFYDVLSSQFQAIEERKSIEAFKSDLAEEFCKWFPPSAWGRRKFSIKFEAGPFTIHLSRSNARKPALKNRPLIKLSSYFEDEYKTLLKSVNTKFPSKSAEEDFYLGRNIDFFWKLRSAAERKLRKDLGPEFVEEQLFVPAGRSFFTSLGKAIAAFEGGILDPLTVKFGRFYAGIRERNFRIGLAYGRKTFLQSRTEIFFGGRLRRDRDLEYLESLDGRKIPLAMLSSGQQELMPLLLSVERVLFRERDLLYVEEPEAHLFPTAQSDLVSYLIEAMSFHRSKRMLVTTHSPYVLSKISVFAKAGHLARKKPRLSDKIDRVVNRSLWLKPGVLTAYAMIDGRLVSVLDSDGLLDGDYLDGVSENLSHEFLSLLEIENGQ